MSQVPVPVLQFQVPVQVPSTTTLRLNDCNVEAETMCSGREFQMWAAATGKARLPTVAGLTGGTTRRSN